MKLEDLVIGKKYKKRKETPIVSFVNNEKIVEEFDPNNIDHYSYATYIGYKDSTSNDYWKNTHQFVCFSGGTIYNPWNSACKWCIKPDDQNSFDKIEEYEKNEENEKNIALQQASAFSEAKKAHAECGCDMS